MQFTNPNTGAFVWSRTAGDIVLGSISPSDATVTFKVKLDGTEVAAFDLTAVSGSITLKFREILEAVLPKASYSFPNTSSARTNTVQITATLNNSTESTSSMYCFRGGSDELRSAFPDTSHWMTWKPQLTRTWSWAKECLSFIKPASTSKSVKAKIYFSDNTDATVTLDSFSSVSSAVSICSIDCSPSRIKALPSASGKTVLAYDVYVSGSNPSFLAHRFVVKPTTLRGREFLFFNSLGALDTVFATGDVSRETDMDVSSVTIGEEEVELANGAVEKFKVHTGGIRDRRTMDQWQDFFRSTDRYVLLQGDVVRRIVVDSIEPEMTENKLSGAAITYHYAKAFTGRYYSDSAIPAFDYSNYEND